MNARIFYMDSMRGILMMLGLVYHSSKVFSPKQDWIIYSEQTTALATMFVEMLKIFRMPAFFIVSGYFAALTLKKYGVHTFIKVRVSRIVIPLVITAITLNSLQAYILTQTGWMDFDMLTYISRGGWVTHLWFLINLVIYFFIAALLVLFFRERLFMVMNQIDTLLLKVPFGLILLFLLPASVIFFLALGQIYPIRVIIKTSLLFQYMPFFFFGMLLFSHKGLLKKFTEFSPRFSLPVVIISLLVINYLYQYESYSWYLVRTAVMSVGMWFSASLCFYLFKRYTDYHSAFFLYLSQISYTVYLFHHGLVIAIGLLLIKYNIGGIFGLFLLMFLVALVSVSIHQFVISKVSILSFLFNGKTLAKKDKS